MWKDATTDSFKVISQKFSGETEENHEKRVGKAVTGSKFEAGTCQKHIRGATEKMSIHRKQRRHRHRFYGTLTNINNS